MEKILLFLLIFLISCKSYIITDKYIDKKNEKVIIIQRFDTYLYKCYVDNEDYVFIIENSKYVKYYVEDENIFNSYDIDDKITYTIFNTYLSRFDKNNDFFYLTEEEYFEFIERNMKYFK